MNVDVQALKQEIVRLKMDGYSVVQKMLAELEADADLFEALRIMVDVFTPTDEPSAQGHVENAAHEKAVTALEKARGVSS